MSYTYDIDLIKFVTFKYKNHIPLTWQLFETRCLFFFFFVSSKIVEWLFHPFKIKIMEMIMLCPHRHILLIAISFG